MFSVYATHADVDDPLSALRIGEQPKPHVLEGWTRVKVSHATLNRHDLFTLRGITSHREGILFPTMFEGRGGKVEPEQVDAVAALTFVPKGKIPPRTKSSTGAVGSLR